MKQISILLILFVATYTKAEINIVSIGDVDNYKKNEWVKVTGKVSKIVPKSRFILTDNKRQISVYFEGFQNKKIINILQKINVGDTLTVLGENHTSKAWFNKLAALKIEYNDKIIYQKTYRKIYSLQSNRQSNSIEEQLAYNQRVHLQKSLKTRRVVATPLIISGVFTSFIGLFSAGDYFTSITALSIGIPSTITGFIIISGSKNTKSRINSIPKFDDRKNTTFFFDLQIKPVPKGGGLFLTGSF